ncbi:universal stress protein [Actinomadura macra]|uniref:universal stress protein n=1 Tax=Actinomadura macra TaxID=46164 RepID=UPI00082F5F05|nr:universal stress protein [Actinomadura macra]
MSDSIIVGTDGSAPSERAVAWAADEAARHGRNLTIVHVTEDWPFDIPLNTAPQTSESLSRTGSQILAGAERIAHSRHPEVPVSIELVSDRTVRALCKLSERAAELVVGHRGLGGFTGLVLGSVSQGAARHAACPVVVVRGEPGSERGEIVAGVSLGEDAATLEYAFRAAATRGARLRIVHAWPFPESLDEAGAGADLSRIEERARWRVVEAHAPWRKRYPGVEVREEIVQEHPAAALVTASREADLVVAGTHGREGLMIPRSRAVSHALLHHAHCPVAIVPAHGSAAQEGTDT